MNGKTLFALGLSVFLLCGLSGLAQAAGPDAEGMMVAGLFTPKKHCYEVRINKAGGGAKQGAQWAVDCSAAKEAMGYAGLLKAGYECVKTNAKSEDECR